MDPSLAFVDALRAGYMSVWWVRRQANFAIPERILLRKSSEFGQHAIRIDIVHP